LLNYDSQSLKWCGENELLKGDDMVKSIVFGVSVCFAILALGCDCNTVESNAHNSMKETTTFEEIIKIALISNFYFQANGKLPDSIEELMLFCSDSKMSCLELNWNNFSWRKIDDGQAEIEHKESNLIIPISLSRDIPNDIMKNYLQERLEKEIRQQ
jgi:hypothetical protein